MHRNRPYTRILPAFILAAQGWAQTADPPAGLTLTQAIEQALENNLRTKVTAERTVESQAQRGIARSALLPNLQGAAYQMNMTANLAAQGLSSGLLPGIPAFIGPWNRFDARIQAVQSLFNLPSIRRYQASRHGIALAEQEKKLAEEQTTTAAALAYIGVLETTQGVAAAEADLQLSRRLLQLAINQKAAGIATGLDVARAETRVAGQQVQLARAQNALDTARLNLLRVTGAPLGGPVSLAEKMKFQPQLLPEPGDAVAEALGARLELRVAAEQVKIAEAERKAAIGEWMPSVSAFGEYGSSGLKPNEVNLPTRAVGVRIDVPIFNGGRTRAEVQVASSRLRQAELQLADLRAGVEKDVRQAIDSLRTSGEQMKAAEKNLDLAQRELSLAQDRFQNGVADNIEVTNAQTALENARRIVVSSLAQFNVTRLNLFSALGRVRDFSL